MPIFGLEQIDPERPYIMTETNTPSSLDMHTEVINSLSAFTTISEELRVELELREKLRTDFETQAAKCALVMAKNKAARQRYRAAVHILDEMLEKEEATEG